MPEIEIGTTEEFKADYHARWVGLLAAFTAACLAAVTISSHRAHTDAILAKTEASDQWAFYQAKKLRESNAALGRELGVLISPGSPGSSHLITEFKNAEAHYEQEARQIQEKAEVYEGDAKRQEARALRFDIGEGMLELALVLCSLFFIGRRMIFPVIAILAGGGGLVLAVAGLFI
jgi:hypothetical protein